MGKNDWIEFKRLTEQKFEYATIEKSWGHQIQRNTKWNTGLNEVEITDLEKQFGFKFPIDYREMLTVINGFETLHIAINPDVDAEAEYDRRCYKYPDDLEVTKWLVDEANQNMEVVIGVLSDAGFDSSQIEGFIPLYAHRALVVLKDRQQSPVLSIWGDDIVLYGQSLIRYWCNEFHIDFGTNALLTSAGKPDL